MKKIIISALVAVAAISASAQSYYVSNPHRDNLFPIVINSHNDHMQSVPFFQAYSQRATSIEVDLFPSGGKLLVASDESQLASAPEFDSLYINRIVEVFRGNGGSPWKGSDLTLTLLVDMKKDGDKGCKMLLETLKRYPEVFNSDKNPAAVRTVVDGDIPAKKKFASYPKEYLMFDGDVNESYSAKELEHIAMFSASIKDYTVWGGKGIMVASEHKAVQDVIDYVHSQGKPIRIYNGADCPNTWLMMYEMGVDIVNTDNPELCATFFSDFDKKSYTNEWTNYEPYKPTYKSDGADRRPKNVILVIGDGMSISQITAAETINDGLAVTAMRYIGMQRTNAADSYVTDSAAAGSALATGKKHYNRHISADPNGDPVPALSDMLSEKGYKIGIISASEIYDATTAVFFAHNTERGEYEDIIADFLDSKVSVLVGSSAKPFNKRSDGRNIFDELRAKDFEVYHDVTKITSGKAEQVVCIDEQLGEYVKEQSDLSLLSDAFTGTVDVLSRDNDKGYFIMVEAAKIDHTGHQNDIRGNVKETINMDKVLECALKIADENEDTLVLVTGDHETGGLTLIGGEFGKRVSGIYTSNDHTAVMLPVFAYGPSAQKFIGVYENTEIPKIIDSLLK